MVTVEYKGLHIVKAKGKTYYYAWRGGPRINAEPGTPGFQKAYAEAVESTRIPDETKFSALITLYKRSDEYKKLADSTKKNWSGWLDRIDEHFGLLRIKHFDQPEAIRPRIRKWRGTYAATPRAADYGMQVLSRILSYAVDPLAKIGTNPCEGIGRIYSANRAAIIWEADEMAQVLSACSTEAKFAVRLAALTGLRAGDLFRLSWSHVGENAIIMTTGKSRHTREVVVPIYGELRELLTEIPRQSPVVLTNSRKRPWTVNGFASVFNKAKTDAKLDERDLHFHDLRGTAATKFYSAGLDKRVIAEILGWEEDHVDKIIRRYVGRNAATEAVIRKLDEARSRTEAVKLAVKPHEKGSA
ncbi:MULTISPECIES: tyrosine-type recombinase/integrase [unclassified Shinella]|uniref:tyrosine-type recombinase/integrase n=1 Tax=unclassified Shinella TaxID=2643062 RepID=UPI00234E5323|nr:MULTISPECIES: site-specific integrase [unclassified Shinella]MCO5153346.1 site-specific integrase [Shinella sp.]MDC7260525.1 site-specific integrase [Shinella sp. HY16]MDC7267420.1 site-specific integrase [Shinella sp. YZ44]